MTDSNKEHVYRTLLQWLKDYDYTIKEDEEKKDAFKYYAKVFPPNENVKFFEIVSCDDFKDGFLLRMSVAFTPKDRTDFEHLKEEAQNNLFIRMHKILSPIRLLCKIENSVISVEKFLFIDIIVNQKSKEIALINYIPSQNFSASILVSVLEKGHT